MQKIVVTLSRERLITPSGLSFIYHAIGKSKFIKRCNKIKLPCNSYNCKIKLGDILLIYIALLCQGKTAFEDINEMLDDPDFFMFSLGLLGSIPSAETLRQRMDAIGPSLRKEILAASIEMLRNCNVKITTIKDDLVVVDMDVTVLDNSNTNKEGVSYTYKGCVGYAPMMAYIGREGYLVNAELREGSQHCQCHTPEFIRETLHYSHQLIPQKLLFRLDAGNDAVENLGIFIEDDSNFIVKRNLRRSETKEEWLHKAKETCKDIRTPREGKTVYVGTTWKDIEYKDCNGVTKNTLVRIVYEITERTISKTGQRLIFPDIECNTMWTNLDWSEDEVINCYHAHGECEQFHSEIKSDMGVERLPSGKFGTNELVLELTILAYNILRMIGQESLKSKHAPETKHPVKRRRIKTVISNLIQIAGHITKQGRRIVLALGCSNVWRHTFLEIYNRFVTV